MAGLMVQGTTSSAGKSFLVIGLCRVFAQDGYRVYPFKSQNMSSVYYKMIDGKKMSLTQALQAKSAGINPEVRMNPILLKPLSDEGSRVIIKGKERFQMNALEYFEYKKHLKVEIEKIYKEIKSENDFIILEGAGSPAEINLKENDIVNMGMAEIADVPVVLIADIDRGGVFASLYGTVKLLEEEERKRIKGLVINKFRGDRRLLDPGIEMIENLLGIPVIGVLPFLDLEWIDESKLADQLKNYKYENEIEEKIEENFDRLSTIIRKYLDMDLIYSLVGIKND